MGTICCLGLLVACQTHVVSPSPSPTPVLPIPLANINGVDGRDVASCWQNMCGDSFSPGAPGEPVLPAVPRTLTIPPGSTLAGINLIRMPGLVQRSVSRDELRQLDGWGWTYLSVDVWWPVPPAVAHGDSRVVWNATYSWSIAQP